MKKTESKNRLASKIILRIVTIVVVALIVCAGLFYFYKKFTTVHKESKHALVDYQLSLCQELVTTKYRYSDIVALKKSAGFSKSYSIIKYTGILRAGIADFTDISYNTSFDGSAITVKIPKAELLGNDIVSLEVFDEKSSLFVPIHTQEIFDEIDSAREETAQEILAEGILDDAQDYAAKIITQFMYSCGFEKVTVTTD